MPAEPTTPSVPDPEPGKKRIAIENFERAKQVLTTGNHDYGISLLKTCCVIDPKNPSYRVELRKAQKAKYNNNLKGSSFAFFSTPGYKAKMRKAKSSRDYLKVIEYGEEVLTKNPWDLSAQMEMAEAFDALGLTNLAVFCLDQARQKYPMNATLNRALARLFEKLGKYPLAAGLWELVLKVNKNDVEAQHKAKDLAAQQTIQQGGYESGGNGSPGSKTHPSLAAGSGTVQTPADKLAKEEAPLRKRLEADPTEPALYVQLAALYRKHGALDRAKAVLQQGLGPTGNHFKLQIELLELDLAPVRKNLEATEAKLKKLKARKSDDPDDGPSEEELTAARAKLLKDVNARETEILKLRADGFPNDPNLRLELGITRLKGGQIDDAVGDLQKVKRDERLKGKASLYLGVAFLKKGKGGWQLAQRNFEDALSAIGEADESNRKEALYHFAVGCAANGDLTRAIELGQELANLDFGYKNINKLLDDWHGKADK